MRSPHRWDYFRQPTLYGKGFSYVVSNVEDDDEQDEPGALHPDVVAYQKKKI